MADRIQHERARVVRFGRRTRIRGTNDELLVSVMTKAERIIKGLTLLTDAGGDGSCDAQHDELFAMGPSPDKLGPEMCAELAAYGWHWDATLESWKIFT